MEAICPSELHGVTTQRTVSLKQVQTTRSCGEGSNPDIPPFSRNWGDFSEVMMMIMMMIFKCFGVKGCSGEEGQGRWAVV
jgi:hypothetical protein